ncbi:hypothetical protein AALP_AA6G187500 [Arabis alpina]|uniref:Uncharacterized protein n=1 Tax=Arabis alpina TaxID=50452 RepID=A0A087GQ52_ARAAL|nr:hypothetical protein AALP_AA6G187500 [Arabis alpina]
MVPEDPTGLVKHPDDSGSSVCTRPDNPRSSVLLPNPDEVHGPLRDYTDEQIPSVLDEVGPRTVDDGVGIGGVIGVDDGVGISGVDVDGSGVQHADVIETVSEVGEPFAAETTSPESLVGAHVLVGTKSVRQGEDVEVVNTDDDDVEADDDNVEADDEDVEADDDNVEADEDEDDVKVDEDDFKADDDDDSGEEEIDD